MSRARPFAYNPSLTPIASATQVGTLAIGPIGARDLGGGVVWWNGPDEQLGYVIATPVSGNTQPTPISGVYASVGFYRSDLTPSSFINWAQIVSRVYGNPQTFSTAVNASNWLSSNGFWNSYPTVVYTFTSYVTCCDETPVTLYSNDQIIVVGSYLFSNPELTIPYQSGSLSTTNCSFGDNGTVTNENGQVVSDTSFVSCV